MTNCANQFPFIALYNGGRLNAFAFITNYAATTSVRYENITSEFTRVSTSIVYK
jgi:hypothetical protein